MARALPCAGDDGSAFGKLVPGRSPITEVHDPFGPIRDRRENLPAELALSRIRVIAVRHRVEEIPERNSGSHRFPAHDLKIVAITLASIRIREKVRVMIHAQNI